jgi:phosphohistidine phosphatase
MKKFLIVARHAKSARDQPTLSDHDRPLHKKWKQHLKQMCHWLVQQNIKKPDLLLVSSATRAQATAHAYAKIRKLSNKKITSEKKLYLASSTTLLKIIEQTDEDIHTLCIVGHNPWLTDLIQTCGSDLEVLPTTGIVVFRYTWELRWNFEPKKCSVVATGQPTR